MASTRVLMGAAMDAVGAAMEGRVMDESDSARMVAFVAGMVMDMVVVTVAVDLYSSACVNGCSRAVVCPVMVV